MAFELPPLPYDMEALAPVMSEETLEYHYGKHHSTYVTTLNKLVEGTPLAGQSLEQVIKASAGDAEKQAIYNNAAQHINHVFFWNCMKPGGATKIPDALAVRLTSDFGSIDAFKGAFVQAAMARFGSGWAWLVLDAGKLRVLSTANSSTMLAAECTPLLALDLWEHAYYIDYRDARLAYAKAFIDTLANWEFAAENLAKAS